MIDEKEVRRTIHLMKPDETLFEVRAIADGKWNASGYFDNADDLIPELKKYEKRPGVNFYITVNSVNEACRSRNQWGRLVEKATPTTSDKDIEAYDWIMIDVDPERPTGTSSSDEQMQLSKQKANDIYKFLQNRGFENPIVALSGNGTHLLYKIGLSKSKENIQLVQNVLKTLDMLFSDDEIKIDLTTCNPSRICKLYGTVAHKGRETNSRPHRMSSIVKSGQLLQTDKSLLEGLVGLLPSIPEKAAYNGYNPRSFDLDEWIAKHGINVERSTWNGGDKYVFESCPFDPTHVGKDAAIFKMSDGSLGFHCFHNSCSQYTWKDLRLLYEPDAYSQKFEPRIFAPNREFFEYKPKSEGNVDDEPIFYTPEMIRTLPRPPKEYIKSGINEIDKRMKGFRKQSVTAVSGLRGSSKSSMISQFTLDFATQGYRTAIFSGELTVHNAYEWLILQAAGRHNVIETFDNFYDPNPIAELTISKWLDPHVRIYNNNHGNKYSAILNNFIKIIEKDKIDVLCIDNLMTLDISELENNQYRQQSKFIQSLTQVAKDYNIAIILVAHPRKSNGNGIIMRLEDVSGSNDIVNMIDNGLIVHRVNNDFKRTAMNTFGWKQDNPIFSATNVIEVAKNREFGLQDCFIPLYFEVESKRLKNTEHEYKSYGWEEDWNELGYIGGDE